MLQGEDTENPYSTLYEKMNPAMYVPEQILLSYGGAGMTTIKPYISTHQQKEGKYYGTSSEGIF